MGRIVDAWNSETDEEIDNNDWQAAGPDSRLEERRDRRAIADSEDEQHSEQSEDCTRSTCRYRIRVIKVAPHHTGHARQYVKNDKPCRSIQLLHLRPDNPQRV